MTGESVSFRITRTTEDLAQTVAALSQRLVKLEQRLEALALQVGGLQAPAQSDPEELRRLDQVAVLLADCRNLLEDSQPLTSLSPFDVSEAADVEQPLAA